MEVTTHTNYYSLAGRALILALILTFVSACTTTTTSYTPPPARIDVQDEFGFTITEEQRISTDVRAQYDQALQSLQRGELESGIQILESVVEIAPDLGAPRIDLGVAHHRAGNLDAAESNLLAALASNPGHPIAHNELGIVYRKSGRFAEARQNYEAALAVYPGYHYARRNLAILCDLYLSDLSCALQNYEAYMATVPSDDEAEMWIKDLRYRMGDGD